MFSLTKGATFCVLSATLLTLAGCVEKKSAPQKSFYNIDSLVSSQVHLLRSRELNKTVSIDDKEENNRLVPDSLQWANELDIFRLIEQVNKASFRDAYVVSDVRDTNSNLIVREIKAQREVPVPMMRLFYLRTPNDLRRIEATLVEENALYTNSRRMVLELDRNHELHRYRVDGIQKMTVGDSVRFTIYGTIE
jgi:hypothetical protein